MMANVRRLQPDARINGVTVQKMAGKRDGRELYIGVVTDHLFGPVISFGAGGTMIELINDRAVELPPLNLFLAQRLIDRVRTAETLGEWRGAPPAQREAIEQMLLRVSEMVCELPQLREMDINPLIVDESGALAVDARIVVDAAPPSAADDHLAILPYLSNYTQEWPMRGGGQYTLRPVQPDDASMLQDLVRGLSEKSRYYRFRFLAARTVRAYAGAYTLIDYDREMALVAVQTTRTPGEDGEFVETSEHIIGVSRYIANPDHSTCEFSLLVDDRYSGQGWARA
jgi:acetyltransferase